VVEALEQRLGVKAGQTTEDMKFTLETVNCLGACAMGPVVVVDGHYQTVRPSEVNRLVEKAARQTVAV
jgi:NADH-quinone oxidoreductase subunit E